MTMVKCRICNTVVQGCFTKTVLFRYDVSYFRCDACGFAFTEAPYWLAEAYQEDLKGIRDIGMVQRNLQVAELTARLITKHLNPKGRFVDYGAGTGLLVRLMRDRGFDYYYDDPFARNIFARCFEAKPETTSPGQYELLTAFEVFEHSPDPLGDVRRMLAYSDSILFSTELQPQDPAALESWFYLLPDAGQHVAFYTPTALKELARQLGLNLFSDGVSLHCLTKRPIRLAAADLSIGHRDLVTRAMGWMLRKVKRLAGTAPPLPSLTTPDAIYVNKLLRERAAACPAPVAKPQP